MIEPYQWLLKNAKELGYKEENVGPASVDLCLGEAKYYLPVNKTFIEFDFGPENYKRDIVFVPDVFYLCSTEEYIKVPSTHCAFINMRSSLARKGLGHKMAGFIDPGFEGEITLELETAIPVRVQKGERIVQLIYMRLSDETHKVYQGKYQGQRGPTLSY